MTDVWAARCKRTAGILTVGGERIGMNYFFFSRYVRMIDVCENSKELLLFRYLGHPKYSFRYRELGNTL